MRHPCYLEPEEFEAKVRVPWDRYRGDLLLREKLEEEARAARAMYDEEMSKLPNLYRPRKVPEWES